MRLQRRLLKGILYYKKRCWLLLASGLAWRWLNLTTQGNHVPICSDIPISTNLYKNSHLLEYLKKKNAKYAKRKVKRDKQKLQHPGIPTFSRTAVLGGLLPA